MSERAATLAILAVIAAGCGRRAPPSSGGAPPPSQLPFPAARWVPERPLYVFASVNLADAQRVARDALELVAPATGYHLRRAIRDAEAVLGVDALHPDPLARIGVDVAAGWTVFGDGDSPTLVVRLAAPAEMTAYLDSRRARGLVTRSIRVDRVEVVSATLTTDATVSWALDGEWMWVHLAPPGTPDDGGRWFAASHAAHATGWTDGWGWASRAAGAAARVVGVLDARGAIAAVARRLPDAVACARLAESLGRVAVSAEGDGHHVALRLTVETPAADRLRSQLLPAPSGWDGAIAGAALAAQWNLDLAAARPAIAPCLAAAGARLAIADDFGVRAARAVLVDFDPDAHTGSGAIALDVTSPAALDHQLDRIPLRRTLERTRSFAGHRGAAIAIPFSVTIEYILEPQLAIAALGEGLVARLVAPGRAPAVPPIATIDVAPPAMSARAWEMVITGLVEGRLDDTAAPAVRTAVEHLVGWRDAHLAITAEPGAIAITASGNRR